jgi:hypothetical protein
MNQHDTKNFRPFVEALAMGKTILYEIEEHKWVELERYYFSAPIEKYRIVENRPLNEVNSPDHH